VQFRRRLFAMKLVVEVDVSQRSGGVSAIARQIGLGGHGHDQEMALISLHRTVAAWVIGLTAADRLQEALTARGIRCEEQEAEGCVIDFRVV
jgi:hypothetical protein